MINRPKTYTPPANHIELLITLLSSIVVITKAWFRRCVRGTVAPGSGPGLVFLRLLNAPLASLNRADSWSAKFIKGSILRMVKPPAKRDMEEGRQRAALFFFSNCSFGSVTAKTHQNQLSSPIWRIPEVGLECSVSQKMFNSAQHSTWSILAPKIYNLSWVLGPHTQNC